MKKRILSAVLLALVICMLMPFQVMANEDGTNTVDSSTYETTPSAAVVDEESVESVPEYNVPAGDMGESDYSSGE